MEEQCLYKELKRIADDYHKDPEYGLIKTIERKARKSAEQGKYELEFGLPFYTNTNSIKTHFLLEGLQVDLTYNDNYCTTLTLKWN